MFRQHCKFLCTIPAGLSVLTEDKDGGEQEKNTQYDYSGYQTEACLLLHLQAESGGALPYFVVCHGSRLYRGRAAEQSLSFFFSPLASMIRSRKQSSRPFVGPAECK